MNNFELIDTDMDRSIVADTIYGNQTRNFGEEMVEVSENIIKEMNNFLKEYSQFVGITKTTFYRIDGYFNEDNLYILDINASFVDGWGNALNFARATTQEINSILGESMPENFYLQDQIYRPEFNLCIDELQKIGIDCQEVSQISERMKTYVYGIMGRTTNVYPYDGIRMDNKMNLALFSKKWQGNNIQIPKIITSGEASWEDLPKDYVYKIAGKNDIGFTKSGKPDGWKVNIGKPKKGKWAGGKWESGKMLAQEPVKTMINKKSESMQLIFMCADDTVIGGYVQSSEKDIINDNSNQSPLIIK